MGFGILKPKLLPGPIKCKNNYVWDSQRKQNGFLNRIIFPGLPVLSGTQLP